MRILMTVSSRRGATREIGAAVAGVLRAAGHDVDEVDPEDVVSVDGYGAVVLGSSVYAGRLGAGLRDLVDRQAGQLANRPVWLFWSGPVGNPLDPVDEPGDVAMMAARTGARGVRVFGGRLERHTLNLAERALVGLIKADEGDFRDFDDIRAWAADIAWRLTPQAAGR